MRRLLEYQRYKEAAAELEQREILTRDVFVRAPPPAEESRPARISRSFSLRAAWARSSGSSTGCPKTAFHEVTLDKITVREKMTLLLDKLRQLGSVLFEALFDEVKTRMEVVVTFLAMLELVKVRAIRIFQEEMAGPIMIEAAAGMDEAAERVVLDETEEETRWSVTK